MWFIYFMALLIWISEPTLVMALWLAVVILMFELLWLDIKCHGKKSEGSDSNTSSFN